MESLLTELAVALVVRTRGAIWRSRPGRLLVVLSAAVAVGAIALPFLPLAPLLGLAAPPPALVAAIAGITVLYVASAELAKRWFYRRTAG